jgi:murein DD-endopeptidase MepM/ murein hydrolase activator NlpD
LTARSQGQRPLNVSLLPASIHPGDVARVEVTGAAVDEPLVLSSAGASPLVSGSIAFHFDPRQGVWRTLVGIDLAIRPGSYQIRIGSAKAERSVVQTIRIEPKQFPVRRLKVEPGFVEPPPAALERIALDAKALAAAYARTSPKQWAGPFLLPVDGTPTSNFGSRSYYNDQPRSPHAGVDFRSSQGTPVRASNHGTIVLAGAMYFTGNTIVIDHGTRLLSVFAHLSEMHVKAGDVVTPEKIVGLVGATGRVTGPHLHWSVRLNGARVDPLSLVAATKTLDAGF